MNIKHKFIIYSGFDNTITNYDIFDKIITYVYSYNKYKEVEDLRDSGLCLRSLVG